MTGEIDDFDEDLDLNFDEHEGEEMSEIDFSEEMGGDDLGHPAEEAFGDFDSEISEGSELEAEEGNTSVFLEESAVEESMSDSIPDTDLEEEMQFDVTGDADELQDLDTETETVASSSLLQDSTSETDDFDTDLMEKDGDTTELEEDPSAQALEALPGEVEESVEDVAETLEEEPSRDDFMEESVSLEETADGMIMSPAMEKPSQESEINMIDNSAVATPASAENHPVGTELLLNVNHEAVVELARTQLSGEEITQLTYGSIIELDKTAGEPVDLVLNGKVVAHGEIVAINKEKLGVRIIGIHQE